MAPADTAPSPTLIPNGFTAWKDTFFHTNSNRVKPRIIEWLLMLRSSLFEWSFGPDWPAEGYRMSLFSRPTVRGIIVLVIWWRALTVRRLLFVCFFFKIFI